MKNVITIMFVLFFVSCGKEHGSTPTSISVSLDRVVSGLNSGGGVIISGKNLEGIESFVLTLGSASETIVELANGNWEFAVVTWSGEQGLFTGTAQCGVGLATLEGVDKDIALDVSVQGCNNAKYFGTGTFNSTFGLALLETVSCRVLGDPTLYPATSTCDGSTVRHIRGEHQGLMVKMSDRLNSIPTAAAGALQSICYESTTSKIATQVRVPVSSYFPFELVGVETGCSSVIAGTIDTKDMFSYEFQEGLGAPTEGIFEYQTRSIVRTTTAGATRLFFADNYLGNRNDALVGIVPFKSCVYSTAGCVSSSVIQNAFNGPSERTKQLLINLFGTTKQQKAKETKQKIFYLGGSCGQDYAVVVNPNYLSGSASNVVTMTSVSVAGALTATFSNNNLLISYDNGASPSCQAIIDFINNSSTLSAKFVGVANPDTTFSSPYVSSLAITSNPGSDSNSNHVYDPGVLAEVSNQLLLGGWNAIMYSNGFLTCSDYKNRKGEIITFYYEDEVMTLRVEQGGAIPAEFGGGIFDVKLSIVEQTTGNDGGMIEFNCTGTPIKGHAVLSHSSNNTSSDLNIREIYYLFQSGGQEYYELLEYGENTNNGVVNVSKKLSRLENISSNGKYTFFNVNIYGANLFWGRGQVSSNFANFYTEGNVPSNTTSDTLSILQSTGSVGTCVTNGAKFLNTQTSIICTSSLLLQLPSIPNASGGDSLFTGPLQVSFSGPSLDAVSEYTFSSFQ